MTRKTKTQGMKAYGPLWAGCNIHGDTLTTANGESYTISELEHLRWERNNYAHLARISRRGKTRQEEQPAAYFSDNELREIKKAIETLSLKLPKAIKQEAKNDT